MAGKRILLVDYDPKSLTYTRALLEGAGFKVSTCGDGLSAIDQFKAEIPDLVLLSAMLPKMHGFEVCSNIRKIPGGEKTPVVIITDVYKGKRYRLDAIQKYGATEYVEKPIEDANLLSILQGLAGGNGAPTVVQQPVAEEKTMQFSRDDLITQLSPPAPAPVVPKPALEKKARPKDDISRKLEESLAGLELGITRSRPKPKPVEVAKANPPKPAVPLPPAADIIDNESPATVVIRNDSPSLGFTSEDLFTDVIASVERELQSGNTPAKGTPVVPPPVAPASMSAAPAPQPVAKPPVPPPPPPPAPVVVEPVTAKDPVKEAVIEPAKPAEKKVHEFDAAMEKKLSSTLSGIRSTMQAKTASQAKAEPPKPAPVPPPVVPVVPEPVVPPATLIAPEPVIVPEPDPAITIPEPKVEPKIEVEESRVEPEAPVVTQKEPEPALPTVMLTREEIDQSIPKEKDKDLGEGINFGQYLLLSKIATGGMAELYKAKRKGVEGFEKILAIKKILPHMSDNEEFITMFIDEAKLAAQLSHHNICQIFDLGKIENSYYIAMEYVHGKDLRAVLRAARAKEKPIPVELAILITSKICSALDYAHRKRDANGQPLNLVHRDVSPQNILISYEGDVKLVDFGIAKAATKVHVTQHGALKGKLLYMSPEQAWGRSVDKRSDVFSVGIVLFEMLSGRPLFFEENDTEVSILDKVREAKTVPVREVNPKVSADLEKILFKALNKNSDQRYQVASEMQKDLDNLFYTEGYNATSASLASFARSLFPEEWTQEGGSRDTMVIDKDTSEQMKAAVKSGPSRPAPKKPAPQAAAQPPSVTKPPVPEPAPTRLEPVPEKKEPQKPKPEPVAPPSGFREISMPDIIPESSGKSNTTFIVLGIIGFAIVVGAIAFFLFRPKPNQNVQPPQQQQQQQAPAQAPQQQAQTPPAVTTQTPSTAPPATAQQTPATSAADLQKAELQKKIVEQQQKLDQIKADEAKKADDLKQAADAKAAADLAAKQEEDRKAAELAKQQEDQKAAAGLLQQQQQAQEQKTEPPPQEDTTKTAPPPEPPAQEPAKTEPAPSAPAAPEVNEGDLVEMTPDVIKPTIINRVDPVYPPVAQSKKVEGTVILSILVSETGSVGDVKVLRPAGGQMGLNEAAVAAVRNWKFRPAVKAGKRVKVWVTYPIVFKVQ